MTFACWHALNLALPISDVRFFGCIASVVVVIGFAISRLAAAFRQNGPSGDAPLGFAGASFAFGVIALFTITLTVFGKAPISLEYLELVLLTEAALVLAMAWVARRIGLFTGLGRAGARWWNDLDSSVVARLVRSRGGALDSEWDTDEMSLQSETGTPERGGFISPNDSRTHDLKAGFGGSAGTGRSSCLTQQTTMSIAVPAVIPRRGFATVWYRSATGYGERFLAAVETAIRQANVPRATLQRVVCRRGGCLSGKAESFDGILFKSDERSLKEQRCILKATEFGNHLHVSVLAWSEGGWLDVLRELLSAIPVLGNFFRRNRSLRDIEAIEVFSSLSDMVLDEAIRQLGDEPVRSLRLTLGGESSDTGMRSGLADLSRFKDGQPLGGAPISPMRQQVPPVGAPVGVQPDGVHSAPPPIPVTPPAKAPEPYVDEPSPFSPVKAVIALALCGVLAFLGLKAWKIWSWSSRTVEPAVEIIATTSASSSTSSGSQSSKQVKTAEATVVDGSGMGNSSGSVYLRIGGGEPLEFGWWPGTEVVGAPPSFEKDNVWKIVYTEETIDRVVHRDLKSVEDPDAERSTYGVSVTKLLTSARYWANKDVPWPADAEPVWALVYTDESNMNLLKATAHVSEVGSDSEYGAEMSVSIDGYEWCGEYGKGPVTPPCLTLLFSGTSFNEGEIGPVHVRSLGSSPAATFSSGVPLSVYATAESGQVPEVGFEFDYPDFRKPDEPGRKSSLALDPQGGVWLESKGTRQKVGSVYSDSGAGAGFTVALAGDLDRDGFLDFVFTSGEESTMLLSILRKESDLVGNPMK